MSGDITTYTWDATYQLLTERRTGSGSYYLTYTYDPVGNRLTKKDTLDTTNNTFNVLNELTLLTPPSGASTTFGYDRVGNLTSEVTGSGYTTYTWDVENRLVKYEQGGSTESMLYSLEGLRQQKSSGGVITAYSWDFLNLLEERDGSGIVQARFTDYPGMWGGLVSENRSGTSSYYGLGKVLQLEETLAPGKHTLKASFAGDANHNASSVTFTLKANKAGTHVAQSSVSGKSGSVVTLKGTLRRNIGGANVVGRALKFFVGGVQVGTGTTGADGVASFDYKITQVAGKYKLKVVFGGDDFYLISVYDKATLTVK